MRIESRFLLCALAASMATAQKLKDLKNNLGAGAYGRCEGDCDTDSDCKFGLNCFERSGKEAVPGCTGAGRKGDDYCYTPPAGTLVVAGDDNLPLSAFPLQKCQGDCDYDGDCAGLLMCFERAGTESVPGCSGSGQSGKDYCYDAGATKNTLRIMGNNGSPAARYPLGMCKGDCDRDSDCSGDLLCFERGGVETVPGCDGPGISGQDYCYQGSDPTPAPVLPTAAPIPLTNAPVPAPTDAPVPAPTDAPLADPILPLQYMGNNGSPSNLFPLKICEGDCDSDSECAGDLKCYQRDGLQPVPGCSGAGTAGTDYCYRRYTGYGTLTMAGDNGIPSSAFPLQACQGDCDSDDQCAAGLYCYQRGFEEQVVPGCDGTPTDDKDYCYNPIKPNGPVPAPVPAPTFAPVDPTPTPPGVTYKPGEKTVLMEGLYLSTGLTARKIATKNTYVQFDTGGQSSDLFHSAPDGAAVFEDTVTGDYVYASNSESSSDGGVGSIRFNAQGQVIGYQRLLFRDPDSGALNKTRTARNCGVGKTYWNTLITCEEWDKGRVWEVDPWGNEPGRMTQMVAEGRAYESAAYDNRDLNKPVFYITTDESNGPLVKYTPNPAVVAAAITSGNYSNVLHSPGGKYEYFVVGSVTTDSHGTTTGTYSWSSNVADGNGSASVHHKNGEGIDIRDGKLYYTSKAQKYLYIIDLDGSSFARSSTVSGAFDSQPDQVARVLNFNDGSTDGILYFCEDGGDQCGVHGRDAQGRFFTILEDGTGAFSGETTGLAFSPNGMFMYVSFQVPGIIFEISRTDGFPFYGSTLDIKYHADGGPNTFRDRMLFEDNAKTCEFNTEMCPV